jgi:hypothetical protein
MMGNFKNMKNDTSVKLKTSKEQQEKIGARLKKINDKED